MANKMQTETHANQHKQGNSRDVNPENIILSVPLKDIFVDADWNARSYTNVTGPDAMSDDKEAKGFEIKDSIHVKGQDTPVVLTPVLLGKSLGGKSTDRPYQLVAGFCRVAAIETLNADEFVKTEARQNGHPIVPNTPDGTVRAIVRTGLATDPKEARSFNVRENTARKAMEVKDKVHAVSEMYGKQKMSAHQIGVELGISSGYVNRLVTIAGLKPAILKHWREGGKIKGSTTELDTQVDVTENGGIKVLEELAKIDADRQVDEYIKLLQPKGEGDDTDDNQWIEAGKKKAKQIGFMLGALERLEFLQVAANAEAWAAVILTGDLKVTGRKEFSASISKKFAKAAQEGYEEGLAEPEVEAEEGEEAPKKGKGKK